MKAFNLLSLVVCLLSVSSISQASPVPVCRSGQLPPEFHGTYRTPSSNTALIFTKNRLGFEGISGGYLKLKSCLVQGRRVITLIDSTPEQTQNFVVTKLPNGHLQVRDLTDGETQVWVRIR
ncbi:MAG: hypothetical protein ACK5Y2_05785 [Bdellovibrionales bacterium]